MAYDLYPAVDDNYAFPPEVRQALAVSLELRNTVIPMTTTIRNNLLAGEKWDGRLIANTTIDRLERYDAGTGLWAVVSESNDIVQHRPSRNRIMNGDFSVNQREFVSIAQGYTFDRWVVDRTGGTVVFSAQTAALGELPESAKNYFRAVITGQAGVSDAAFMAQSIESVRVLSGKTVTISFWAKAASGTPKIGASFVQGFGTGGTPSAIVYSTAAAVTISTVWARYSITLPVPSIAGKVIGTDYNSDYLSLNLWFSGGSTYNAYTGGIGIQNNTFNIWGVQVEEGSYPTPYDQRTFADELAACQRYYYRIPSGEYAPCIIDQASRVLAVIEHPVPMRRYPTVTKVGSADVLEPGVNWYPITAITDMFGVPPHKTVYFSATFTGTSTIGKPAYIYPKGGGYLEVIADL